MSDLRDTIKSLHRGDADDTARAVFDHLKVPKKWRDLFYDVVRDECRRLARDGVRCIEVATPIKPTRSGDRADFLSSHFWNGETYVTWGKATVDDHEGRILVQQRLRDAITEDIDRHRQAIEAILDAGVTCLDDLEPVAC